VWKPLLLFRRYNPEERRPKKVVPEFNFVAFVSVSATTAFTPHHPSSEKKISVRFE
jgi:hypothetical protein